MAVDEICLIHVTFPCYFHGNLFELLLDCSSRIIQVRINIFNIYHNEFRKALSIKQCPKWVLPVSHHINFECLHRLDINDMNKLGDLVNENKWTNATQLFGELLRE